MTLLFDTHALESACLEHMNNNGLPFSGSLNADGKIHRYSADSKQNKPDEWYIAFLNMNDFFSLFCIYGSHSDGSRYEYNSWYEGFRVEGVNDDDYKAYLKERRAQCEIELKKEQECAAQEANRIWDNASEEPPTSEYDAYIRMKRIKSIGIKFAENPQGYPSLVIPVHDNDLKLHSLQFISANPVSGKSYKTFLAGGKKSGNFRALGEIAGSPITFITEGYSTGVSVYLGLKQMYTTVIAFDAGNIPKVLSVLRKKYPNHTFIIAGDNDDAGRGAGDDCVRMFKCRAVYPQFPADKAVDAHGKKYTDFNDLGTACGEDEVARQLQLAIDASNTEVDLSTKGAPPIQVDPCSDVDMTKLPGLIREYMDVVSGTTNAQPIMILNSFLVTASAFVKRSVLIKEGSYFQDLYANIWIINVAKSGEFKTTALNKGSRLARKRAESVTKEVQKLTSKLKEAVDEEKKSSLRDAILRESVKNVVLPDKITTEALFMHLSQGHAGAIFASEFGAWLKSLEQTYNNDLKTLFTVLYDVPPSYSYVTKTQGAYNLINPYVSICGVSTMPWLKEHIKPDDVSSGFFARFLIFTPLSRSGNIPDALPKQQSPQLLARCQELEERIIQVLEGINGQIFFTLPPDCQERYKTMYEEINAMAAQYDEQDRELLEPYVKRWGPYVLKIATLLRIFEDGWDGSSTLSIASLESAMMIVRAAMHSTVQLFASEFFDSEHQRKCRKVYEWIAANGTVARSKLIGSKVLRGGSDEYKSILETLVESGRIELIMDDPKKKTTWRYRVCP